MTSKTLLKNGVVVVHGADNTAHGVKSDLLIEGDRIAQIASNITLSEGLEVIDCTDKIIAPGFIDTHRHMWNTVLRGVHGNDNFADYLVKAILQGGSFEPRDVFWGQLASSMECINSGTTTVVDHSHMNYSEDHPKAAIAATATSGLRSIYGYCFNVRVDSWSPFAFNQGIIAPFANDALKALAAAAPFANGRVTLGIAFDLWFLPQEMLQPMFESIKDMGIKHITTHNIASPPGKKTNIEIMHECGVLSPASQVILSHANYISESDSKLVKDNGAFLSSTPSLELGMGMGTPACFDADRDVQSCSALGVDCHNVALASIVSEMRCALLHSRATYNDKFIAAGKMPARLNHTVQEAYALGTIQGARAVGMEKDIGSLAVGKKADIVVFDALSPSMICGAQSDPITAIVMHSTPGDILMTFVDGIPRKRDGKVLPVQVTAEDGRFVDLDASTLTWSDVSKGLLQSQITVQEKIGKFDLEAAKNDACASFGFDPSLIVASL